MLNENENMPLCGTDRFTNRYVPILYFGLHPPGKASTNPVVANIIRFVATMLLVPIRHCDQQDGHRAGKSEASQKLLTVVAHMRIC